MIQESQEAGILVDKVQLYEIVQEDPHYTMVPTRPKEEVNVPWAVSEEGGNEERSTPGPLVEGHPVLIGTPSETFSDRLVKNNGIWCLDTVLEDLKREFTNRK